MKTSLCTTLIEGEEMKFKFKITHPNGDVTFCKVTPFGRDSLDALVNVRECHPGCKVEFVEHIPA